MNEQELREMIRESIARHLGDAPAGRDAASPPFDRGQVEPFERTGYLAHAAFIRLPLARGGDGDGACLIEPAVRCNHCGYCQSYGH